MDSKELSASEIEEAESRKAEVQASWDESTREKRRVEKHHTPPEPWTPPEIMLDPELAAAFNVRTLDTS